MNGQLSFQVDRESGLIRVHGSGIWAPKRVQDHFMRLERAVRSMRAEQRQVFVLVDLREAAVQTAETAEALREATSRIYREADHAAVVCATALLALQVKRAAQVPHLATFHDLAEAIAWLDERRVPVA